MLSPLTTPNFPGDTINRVSTNSPIPNSPLPTPYSPQLRTAILCLGGLGGSGKVATELARGLANLDTKVLLLTSPQAEWVCKNEESSFSYLPVNAPKSPTTADPNWVKPLAQEIIQHVKTHDIAVLNVHYAVGLVEAALLARQELAKGDSFACTKGDRNLSVCLTLHGSDVTKFGYDPDYAPQLRNAIISCDEVTAVSNWLADKAVKVFDLEKRPRVIHNAIDLEFFHPFRRWIAAPSKTLNLCHISNLRDVKRPLDAITVLARVIGAGVPARLLMIGDGPNLEKARKHARELGLANEVMFLGASSPNEVVRWLAVSDLQLVTSESESFCLAALESMACEVPVVGTFCGGLEEVMGVLDADMPNKLLSAPGDTTTMATKIVQLFNSPSTYQQIRDSLRKKIKQSFSHSKQLEAYAKLFSTLQSEVSQ
ncbi:MAG: glycosyltransferase [Scytonematopsis contorta HA4267-MV1]|nr:glycosyltransferase [Scytonematopsis contorta HA4267-MV1]